MNAQELAEALAQFPYEERCRIFEAAHDLAPPARIVKGVRFGLFYHGELGVPELAKRIREAGGRKVYDLRGALEVARELIKGVVLYHEVEHDAVSSDHWKLSHYEWRWDMSDIAKAIPGMGYTVSPILGGMDVRPCWPTPTA